MNCYNQLCSEKQVGMALGPIPYSAIANWCHDVGIDDVDDIDDIAAIIWKADNMVREFYDKKQKSTIGPKANGELPKPTMKVIGSSGPDRGGRRG